MMNKAGVTMIAFTPDGQHILVGKHTRLIIRDLLDQELSRY